LNNELGGEKFHANVIDLRHFHNFMTSTHCYQNIVNYYTNNTYLSMY